MTMQVIVDLQFGSTGKGLLAGYLAQRWNPDTVVAAWGPNSGHTFIDESGRKMVNIALPNGIVSNNLKHVLLGPGSVINPMLLLSEMEQYADLIGGADVGIHEHAAVVTEEHRQMESERMVGIGSTMKGVGEAMIQKMRRNIAKPNIAKWALRGTPLEGLVIDSVKYAQIIDASKQIQVEGSQGYSLSLNHGMWPYVTSRDCTVHQVLNDCAIPRDIPSFTIGVARTYPIRVANRFDQTDGRQIGWSGPCYPDQREIKWEDIGVPPELTTVTRLPRRVFTFSLQQIAEAVRMNAAHAIFLNFCNYPLHPQGYNEPGQLIQTIERHIPFAGVILTGWGPTVNDVRSTLKDVRDQ
jgi:adenylosuccinate synthase